MIINRSGKPYVCKTAYVSRRGVTCPEGVGDASCALRVGTGEEGEGLWGPMRRVRRVTTCE